MPSAISLFHLQGRVAVQIGALGKLKLLSSFSSASSSCFHQLQGLFVG